MHAEIGAHRNAIFDIAWLPGDSQLVRHQHGLMHYVQHYSGFKIHTLHLLQTFLSVDAADSFR